MRALAILMTSSHPSGAQATCVRCCASIARCKFRFKSVSFYLTRPCKYQHLNTTVRCGGLCLGMHPLPVASRRAVNTSRMLHGTSLYTSIVRVCFRITATPTQHNTLSGHVKSSPPPLMCVRCACFDVYVTRESNTQRSD